MSILRKEKFKLIAIVLLVAIIIVCGCIYYVNRNSRSASELTLQREKDTVYRISATSKSSNEAGRIGQNLIIENMDEPIEVTFWQVGKNRKMLLQVYYDYHIVNFSVGDKGNYADEFKFEIDEDKEKKLTIFLTPDIIEDTLCHRLIFNFIPSYDEYAKDKLNAYYNTTVSDMYQLHFGELNKEIQYSDKHLAKLDAQEYYPHKSIPIMLNTDISIFEMEHFNGIMEPEKHYIVNKASEFSLNYIVSNVEPMADTALLFITVGNQETLINGKEYLWIDLKKNSMAVGKISFFVPDEVGIYDVIGYVVFDPFEPMEYDPRSSVGSSIRFTIEVK